MSKTNDGGQAFPVHPGQIQEMNGMSLRDWFAGQIAGGMALAALLLGVSIGRSITATDDKEANHE